MENRNAAVPDRPYGSAASRKLLILNNSLLPVRALRKKQFCNSLKHQFTPLT